MSSTGRSGRPCGKGQTVRRPKMLYPPGPTSAATISRMIPQRMFPLSSVMIPACEDHGCDPQQECHRSYLFSPTAGDARNEQFVPGIHVVQTSLPPGGSPTWLAFGRAGEDGGPGAAAACSSPPSVTTGPLPESENSATPTAALFATLSARPTTTSTCTTVPALPPGGTTVIRAGPCGDYRVSPVHHRPRSPPSSSGGPGPWAPTSKRSPMMTRRKDGKRTATSAPPIAPGTSRAPSPTAVPTPHRRHPRGARGLDQHAVGQLHEEPAGRQHLAALERPPG